MRSARAAPASNEVALACGPIACEQVAGGCPAKTSHPKRTLCAVRV